MRPEKEKRLFEEAPVFKAILSLALPSVIGQIILVIYNMADTFFVGLTGSDAMITAVTVCMPAFMFLSAISNLFGVGGASVISRSLGKNDCQRAKHAAAFAFWGCLAVTALYSLGVFLLMDPFINLLGGGAQAVHSSARAYMTVTVVLGGLATGINTLLSHLVRAEGRSLQAGLGIALGGILNIALDPLFMFVILPAGQEALGAGIATTVANFIATAYYAVLIFCRRKSFVLSVKPKKAMFASAIPKDIVSAGIPACLMTLCENISYAILDNLMAAYGIAVQAGMGVAKKVNMLAHCTVRGVAQGVLPLIGYSYACGNRRRMRHTVMISAAISVTVSTLCMAVCLLLAPELVGLFIQSESESLTYGAAFLRIVCIGAPFSACAYTVISFFQAVGQGGKSLVLALLRKGVLDIPLMFVLRNLIPIYGLVAATPIADILCCAAAMVLILVFFKKHAFLGQSHAKRHPQETGAERELTKTLPTAG